MRRISRPFAARRSKYETRLKEAWRSALESQEKTKEVFVSLEESVRIALLAKKRAMQLAEAAAPEIEGKWGVVEGTILHIQQAFTHLKPIEEQYDPEYARTLEQYQNLKSRYDNVSVRAEAVKDRLNIFTIQCEEISSSPEALRKWLGLMTDSHARLNRLRQNMTEDGLGLPRGADVDELGRLLPEGAILLESEDYDALVGLLDTAEWLARDIEEKFTEHLKLTDYERMTLLDVMRRVQWAQRHIDASRALLSDLRRDYDPSRVEDVAQKLEDASTQMVTARTYLEEADVLLSQPSPSEVDVAHVFRAIEETCWDIGQLCNAVDRRKRELERELGQSDG